MARRTPASGRSRRPAASPPRPAGDVGPRREHGGDAEQRRHPRSRTCRSEAAAIEALVQHQRRAGGQRQPQRHVQPEDVEQRQGHEADVVGAEDLGDAEHLVQVGRQVAVGEHGRLGLARRPRGEQQDGEVGLGSLHRVQVMRVRPSGPSEPDSGCAGAETSSHAMASSAAPARARGAGQDHVAGRSATARPGRRPGSPPARPPPAHGRARWRAVGVEGDGDRAGGEDPEIGHDEVDRRGPDDRHPVVGTDAELGQRGRRPPPPGRGPRPRCATGRRHAGRGRRPRGGRRGRRGSR